MVPRKLRIEPSPLEVLWSLGLLVLRSPHPSHRPWHTLGTVSGIGFGTAKTSVNRALARRHAHSSSPARGKKCIRSKFDVLCPHCALRPPSLGRLGRSGTVAGRLQ